MTMKSLFSVLFLFAFIFAMAYSPPKENVEKDGKTVQTAQAEFIIEKDQIPEVTSATETQSYQERQVIACGELVKATARKENYENKDNLQLKERSGTFKYPRMSGGILPERNLSAFTQNRMKTVEFVC